MTRISPKQLDLSKDLSLQGSGRILLTSGDVSLPSLAFNNATGTGIYQINSAKIGFATSGTLRLSVNTVAVESTVQHRAPTGSSSLPSYSFIGNTNTGLWLKSGKLTASVNGADCLELSSDGSLKLSGTGALTIPNGTTAERPSSPQTAMVRLNSTTGYIEYYQSNAWNPLAKLSDIEGWTRTPVTTSSYNVTNSDYYIGVNYNGNVSIVLPSGTEGKRFVVKDESGNADNRPITITTTGGQTIDGKTGATIAIDYGALSLVFSGTEWHIY